MSPLAESGDQNSGGEQKKPKQLGLFGELDEPKKVPSIKSRMDALIASDPGVARDVKSIMRMRRGDLEDHLDTYQFDGHIMIGGERVPFSDNRVTDTLLRGAARYAYLKDQLEKREGKQEPEP